MGRIANKGYSHVKSLKKDSNGVWRGTAEKDGQSVGVWLDFKGNVGQQS
jgi:putative membrane protein